MEYTGNVSIPFKRESVSELIHQVRLRLVNFSFNSLQTGKRI